MAPSVAVVTLGCARNEVDSEELTGRLTAAGWRLTDPGRADVVLVNTCGFVTAAKKDSIDTLLGADRDGAKVVAVGCLAERYGVRLADELPEVAAVLGFEDYPAIAARLHDVLAGRPVPAHQPVDRRRQLPIAPLPPVPAVSRRRLDAGPVAPLKIASGCDRRCAFCAIPTYRGRFVSRPPDQVLAEAHWLAGSGVRELLLVSENATSYGQDLGDPRRLEALLGELAAVPGIVRVRLSYLQPAELRPSLIETLATTPGVAAYFDVSFQHASAEVLRRMRRFGDADRFLRLLDEIRTRAPRAGVRSNVIVGFPGERRRDVAQLERFVAAARLDAVGVFGYSDEEGTAAARLPAKLGSATIARRVERMQRLAEELTAQRAEERVGEVVEALVESVHDGVAEGRAEHQAPEVDGTTTLPAAGLTIGDLVLARVRATAGVDLVAEPVPAGAGSFRVAG